MVYTDNIVPFDKAHRVAFTKEEHLQVEIYDSKTPQGLFSVEKASI